MTTDPWEALPSVANPPLLDRLTYRVGDHGTFMSAILERIGEDGAARGRDPVVALVDAWATVLDVLTFYQERIAGEGFLRTAGEAQSLYELAAATGYAPRPGASAAADVAVTIDDAAAGTTVVVPASTRLQSVPGPGEVARVFETTTALVARPEWNAMAATRSDPHGPVVDAVQLAGTSTGLRPGDGLLVGGTFRIAKAVVPDAAAGSTRVELAGAPAQASGDRPDVLVLRTRARLFGHDAMEWSTLPPETQNRFWPADAGPVPSEWPGMTLADLASGAGPSIVLDGPAPGVTAGGDSYVVLSTPTPDGTLTAVGLVTSATEETLSRFGITAKVARLGIDGGVEAFDRRIRTTTVHVQSERRDVAPVPLPELTERTDRIVLERLVPDLAPGRVVIVTAVDPAGGPIAVRASLTKVERDRERTVLQVHPAVPSCRRASLRVLANVVGADEGETRTHVLGDGDASAAFAEVRLLEAPLSHTTDTTSSGVTPALTVRVDDAAWRRRGSIGEAAPGERAWSLAVDPDGRGTITFGDGQHGARPPTGRENIAATYRVGLGSGGNVGAGSLRVLLDRPQRVRDVVNPLPASGGADAETPDELRENVGLATAGLGRIVTLRDAEDFARRFTGVRRARADWVRGPRGSVVHVTVVGPGGDAVPPVTLERLRAAADAARHPTMALEIGTAVIARFAVSLCVLPVDGRQGDVVAGALTEALRRAFGVDARDLVQDVAPSDVVATAHEVDGVQAVVLDRLSLTGDATVSHLAARPARPDAASGAIEPATILLLDRAPDALVVRPVDDLATIGRAR